jgi:hypothetical protein
MRGKLVIVGIVLASTVAHARPPLDRAICGGGGAIVSTWRCGDSGSDEYCTLWGVDVARSGQWGQQSLFAIERPHGVERVEFDEACRDGRCSRPEYAVCSIPVSESVDEALLRASPVRMHWHNNQGR